MCYCDYDDAECKRRGHQGRQPESPPSSTEFASAMALIDKEMGPAIRQVIDREISRHRNEADELRRQLAKYTPMFS